VVTQFSTNSWLPFTHEFIYSTNKDIPELSFLQIHEVTSHEPVKTKQSMKIGTHELK
jgi:hypothetical protein